MLLILTAFLETSPITPVPGAGTPLWVPLLIVCVVLLLLWWGLTRGRVFDENFPAGHPVVMPAGHHDTAVAAHGPATHEADDLKLIEGIGPAIAQLLSAHGIDTFARLAVADSETLLVILRDGGMNLAAPETWPEQARLAAAGQWDELSALQDVLQAGKRAP